MQEWVDELWSRSKAAAYGLSKEQLVQTLSDIGEKQNWGAAAGAEADHTQRLQFLNGLRVEELVLARACAAGNEQAWEAFLMQYRETLYGAAYSITKQEAAGRELADSLYADLYGTVEREGVRQSRLNSYTGRGSLAGWLRSVLAQRFVDGYRRSSRQVSLEDENAERIPAVKEDSTPNLQQIETVSVAIREVFSKLPAEDRMLLALYYMDGRTLMQIARMMGVHESTASRKLSQLTRNLKKGLLKQLERGGMSRSAAEEAMQADVRDFDIDLRRLLQGGRNRTFHRIDTSRE